MVGTPRKRQEAWAWQGDVASPSWRNFQYLPVFQDTSGGGINAFDFPGQIHRMFLTVGALPCKRTTLHHTDMK
jgi:hypothetical protein